MQGLSLGVQGYIARWVSCRIRLSVMYDVYSGNVYARIVAPPIVVGACISAKTAC